MDSGFAREVGGKGLGCLFMISIVGIIAIIAWVVYFVWRLFA